LYNYPSKPDKLYNSDKPKVWNYEMKNDVESSHPES